MEKNYLSKQDLSTREKLIELRQKRKNYSEMARELKVSRQRIHQLLTGYKSPASYSKKRRRKHWHKIRERVLKHYGGENPKYKNCGFNKIECLDIDHINNDGAKQRKKIKGTSAFYRWLINNNFPKGYQLLCKNCNWLKYLKSKENI